MATDTPSAALRAQLRAKILKRIAELHLKDYEAAGQLGLSRRQMVRLRAGEDVFSLDRLVDAAGSFGIVVRMRATRPYGEE